MRSPSPGEDMQCLLLPRRGAFDESAEPDLVVDRPLDARPAASDVEEPHQEHRLEEGGQEGFLDIHAAAGVCIRAVEGFSYVFVEGAVELVDELDEKRIPVV